MRRELERPSMGCVVSMPKLGGLRQPREDLKALASQPAPKGHRAGEVDVAMCACRVVLPGNDFGRARQSRLGRR
jgi:hypothetical protein